jgi:SAM-dependent methyltransferase
MNNQADQHPSSPAAFDAFATDYDGALQQGLAVTGESKDYYALRRVEWLAHRLRPFDIPAHPNIMDYGCGTGDTAPLLHRIFNAARVIGLDVSEAELAIARTNNTNAGITFQTVANAFPVASADIIYCNGTFHHIPPNDRPGVVQFLFDALKPGGYFGLWENNPLNPGTRLVMSRIPFDRDAITLGISESKRLLRQAGFQIIRSDTLFYFPRSLRMLRPLEPLLSALPFGGQYLILAHKPIG